MKEYIKVLKEKRWTATDVYMYIPVQMEANIGPTVQLNERTSREKRDWEKKDREVERKEGL